MFAICVTIISNTLVRTEVAAISTYCLEFVEGHPLPLQVFHLGPVKWSPQAALRILKIV